MPNNMNINDVSSSYSRLSSRHFFGDIVWLHLMGRCCCFSAVARY